MQLASAVRWSNAVFFPLSRTSQHPVPLANTDMRAQAVPVTCKGLKAGAVRYWNRITELSVAGRKPAYYRMSIEVANKHRMGRHRCPQCSAGNTCDRDTSHCCV